MKKILTFLLLSILIPIQMQADYVSTWTEEVRNGNLEGNSTTCFRVIQGGSLATNFISEVGGVNNSRCIKIQSDGSNNAQSTALAIMTPNKKWMAGDSIDVQFMVCAAQAATIYAKTAPNNSSSSNDLVPFLDGTYQVNKNWKILSYKGVVTSEQAGRNGTDGFILLLNTPGETNTFFFDNISVKSQKTTYVADPIETVIDNVNYRLDPNTHEATVISYRRYSGVIAVPSSVTYDDETYNVIAVDDMAFSASGVPTNVILSDGITTLGTQVFGTQTTNVTLPSTLTSVGDALFLGCDDLQAVTCFAVTPPVITSGSSPMISTPNTATLYVPAGSLSAYQDAPGWSVFSNIEEINTTETEVTIDGINYRLNLVTNEATVIWTSEWSEEVTIPSTVTSGGVGYDVTTVNGGAINSPTITSITLPEGLTTIGNLGIYGCNSLTTVSLPSTLNTIGTYTFLSCESLTSVYCYAETPPTLTEADGVCNLYVASTATLYVPAGSLSAYQNATGWSSFNNIVEMVEPFDVLIGGINYSLDPSTHEATVIFKWRYSGDITIPSSVSFEDQTYAVTSIYEYAFTGMDLTSITLPEGLTTIGNGAFSSNASLTTATLPSTLTNVGSFIFYHSSHLETVYCYATTPPVLADGAVIPTPNTATLYVPAGSLSAYQNATGWSSFSNIVEMESSPTGPELIVNGDFEGIDMSAFSGQQLGGGSFNRYDYTTDDIVSWDGDGNHFLYVYFTPVEINESTGEPWAYQDQLIIKLNGSLAPGDHFRFSMRAKNSGGAITINGHGNNGSVWNLLGEFNLTDEWQTFVVEGVVDETLSNDITKLELYLPVTDYSMGSFMFDDFSLKKVVETIPGDVNGDSEVDVADFTLLANYLLGKSPAGFNVEAADVAGGPGGAPDGSIDIADLTGIANIILHSHSSGE